MVGFLRGDGYVVGVIGRENNNGGPRRAFHGDLVTAQAQQAGQGKQ